MSRSPFLQTQPSAMEHLQALRQSIITNLPVIGVATLLFWLILSFRNSGAWKVRYILLHSTDSDSLLAKTIPYSWL